MTARLRFPNVVGLSDDGLARLHDQSSRFCTIRGLIAREARYQIYDGGAIQLKWGLWDVFESWWPERTDLYE